MNSLGRSRSLSFDEKPLTVSVDIRAYIHRVRTAAPGLGNRHRGVDAEFSRFIRGGGYHATMPGLGTDDDRTPLVFGMFPLFTAGEKGIEVNVGDPTL